MEGRYDLVNAARLLTNYAVERQAGFERHSSAVNIRQPECRNEWIRNILLGMAALENSDGAAAVMRFNEQLRTAKGCAAVENMPPAEQRQIVRMMQEYMGALSMLRGDPRGMIMDVRHLLEDMTMHLPWDANMIGLYPAREQAEHLLVHLTARQPLRFTRILLGTERGPCGSDYVSGSVTGAEDIRGSRLCREMCAQYPGISEWPAICTLYRCGMDSTEFPERDASEFDLALMREQGDRFLNTDGVRWGGVTRELCVPVQTTQRSQEVYEMGGMA